MQESPRSPIAVRMIDLAEPLTAMTGLSRYTAVRIFLRRSHRLLGTCDILTDGVESVSVERLRLAIASDFGTKLFKEELARTLGAPSPEAAAPPGTLAKPLTVSIIVPTCERPDDLRRCLQSVTVQTTRHSVEVIVVDNKPSSPAAATVTRGFPSVRLVIESRPGLSYARNAGIAVASGEIIVTTDDDVVAPADWIEKLIEPFARPDVWGVTGNVLPLELETESQCQFEIYGGLGKGYKPREFNQSWFRAQRDAPPTWEIGATANAAFRAHIFRNFAIGLLDEALGAGTPTGCSEDTYLFYRILKNGGTIVYLPSTYIWHRHRSSMKSLRHQVRSYSKGHVAYHLTTLMRDGERRALWRLAMLPKVHLQRMWHRLRGWSDYPIPITLIEIAGNFAGPFALWRSRRRVRRLKPSTRLRSQAPEGDTVGIDSDPEHAHAVPLESPISQGPTA
jgi:O-antigen biosynthesis protein